MTNQDKDSDLISKLFKIIRDIVKILVDVIRPYPWMAAVILVLVIAVIPTTVAMICGFGKAIFVILAFFILSFLIVVGIILMQVHSQKEQIRRPAGEKLFMEKNTINLANRLNDIQKNDIIVLLRGAATDVAKQLNLPIDLIRSNLFGVDSQGHMRMVQELTYNMNREEEFTISMPIGYGSTGRCFQSGKPNIAIFREGWGENVIEGEELSKVHPDLKWIISLPVPPGDGEARPIWVLNVDGLEKRQSEKELRDALRPLFYWSQMIYTIIKQLSTNIGEET